MTQREANRIKDRAVASAKSTLCTDVLRYAGCKTRRRGNQVYSICYNCGSETKGVKTDKFSVNTDKNLYHCFGCGVGGGAPKLYSELYGISYMEACLILAYKNNDISKEEYEELSSNNDAMRKLTNDSQVFGRIEEREAEEEVELKAPVDTVDLVYRHLLKLPQFHLNSTDRDYLLDRGVSKDEIDEVGFFSYTEKFSIDRLILSIRKEKPAFTYNDFMGVAGFFFEYTNKERTLGRWRFKAPYKECVGIPLKDSYGRITALQMRYYGTKETKNKYFYVSSKGVKQKNENFSFGAGCGSPVATIFPEKVTNPIFCIGEGFFKMKELSKEGSVCFSIQGVNSFHYVADEIKSCIESPIFKEKTKEYQKSERVRFLIVFDVDMYRKIQVLEAGLKVVDFLKKKFEGVDISFLVWDATLGKGYDDMKYACINKGIDYHYYMKAVPSDTFCDFVKKSLIESDTEYFKLHPEKFDRGTKHRQESEWSNLLYRHLYLEKVACHK